MEVPELAVGHTMTLEDPFVVGPVVVEEDMLVQVDIGAGVVVEEASGRTAHVPSQVGHIEAVAVWDIVQQEAVGHIGQGQAARTALAGLEAEHIAAARVVEAAFRPLGALAWAAARPFAEELDVEQAFELLSSMLRWWKQ